MNTKSMVALSPLIQDIHPPDETRKMEALARLDTLTKPLGSLGKLEKIAAQVVAIGQAKLDFPIGKAAYIFAADHGVTAEGVSAYPKAVTQQMVLNFLTGGAAVSVLARFFDVALNVIDVGVDADFADAPGLLQRKVRYGTRNMLHEEAMTDAELASAISVGAEMADHAASAGHLLVAVGEMGIGNTTAASAITCALTGAQPESATGRGTGVDEPSYRHKIEIVRGTLSRHFSNSHLKSDMTSALEILRCVGGLEIAAMTGMMLGAAMHRLVIVADGFISTVAAALAVAIAPEVRSYLVAGHRSQEPGHTTLLTHLELSPLLDLGLRLGEGSGAVLAMPIIESALRLYEQMATFSAAGVSEASA